MDESLQPNSMTASSNSAVFLRRIGVVIFLLGLAIATIVGYYELAHPIESDTDSLVDGYYKNQSAQMQKMLGNLGTASLTLREDFQRIAPAIVIAVLSIVIASMCLVVAGRIDRAGKM